VVLAQYPLLVPVLALVPAANFVIERIRIDTFVLDTGETAELQIEVQRNIGITILRYKRGTTSRRPLDMFFPEGANEITIKATSERSVPGANLVVRAVRNEQRRTLITT